MSDFFEMSEEVFAREQDFFGNLAVPYFEDQMDLEQSETATVAPVAAPAKTERLAQVLDLKQKLSNSLVSLQQLRPPAGVATGVDVIDDFLLWRGIPKGDITLLSGKPGAGATSLWIQSAAKLQAEKKWAAWINSDWELMPSALKAKNINLEKLLVVSKPQDNAQLFWILQEMISSTLFDLIGLHVQEGSLKIHQLQKLKKLARTHQVALVIISHAKTWATNPLFSLVIDCQGDFYTVKRALQRPTPFTIPGGLVHADLMSQLATESRKLLR